MRENKKQIQKHPLQEGEKTIEKSEEEKRSKYNGSTNKKCREKQMATKLTSHPFHHTVSVPSYIFS